jgi:hypothetical protein
VTGLRGVIFIHRNLSETAAFSHSHRRTDYPL